MCIITHDSVSGYVPNPVEIVQENLENNFRNLSLIDANDSILNDSSLDPAQEVVLRKCGQVEPTPFTKCYPER